MTPKSFDDAPALDAEDIMRRLRLVCEILNAEKQIDAESFRKTIINLKPFCDYRQEIERVIKEKFHA